MVIRINQQKRQARIWSTEMIPKEYRDHTLRSWVDRVAEYGGEDWRLWAQNICTQLLDWAETGKWLVLWSGPGSGKTGLLIALLRLLAEAERVVSYKYIYDLFEKMKSSFDGSSDLTLAQVIESVATVDVIRSRPAAMISSGCLISVGYVGRANSPIARNAASAQAMVGAPRPR